MNEASNSDNGIGLSQNDAASHISSLLDSNLEIAATDETSSVENETDEVSTPSDDAIENSEEQTLEDSDEPVDAETDEADEAEVAAPVLSDDTEVEINGQKMSLKELKQGYERHADYTRKTQALAEASKKYDAGIDVIREQGIAFLQNLEREMGLYMPQQPDWQALAAEDPAEYVRQQHEWQQRNAQIQRVRNELAQVEAQKAEREAVLHKQALQEGQRVLHEMHPELAKQETGKARELGSYLLNAGIPAEALERETNPVLFSIAYKAMQYDQLQAQKAKAVKVVDAKPPLTTPASSPARSNTSQSVIDKKMGALKRSGSVNDAASVLKHLL